ncbi:MAG: CBM20 domain-containing protein [Candidatus Zhuqueibacterota bacterium]
MRLTIQIGFARKVCCRFLLTCQFVLAITLISCARTPIPNYSVKFIARLEKSAIGPQVYLTGKNKKLGDWNPVAVPMTQESDSLWSTTLSFQDGESIEYKVTAQSWHEGRDNGSGH